MKQIYAIKEIDVKYMQESDTKRLAHYNFK